MATANDALVSKLLTASTQVERIDDIQNDSDYVFNFLNATKAVGQDGFLVLANSADFPAVLTGNGAMAVGVLGPCGLNPPHIHPRATELQIVVQGGPFQTQFIMENGARLVQNTVHLGSMTVFPKGSIHYQQNLGCDPAVFIASFDFVDPGTSTIAPNFLSLDKGVVNATLGEIGVDFFSHLKLPPGIALGAQECLDRCHIDRSTFNFSSTFADYVAFSNSTWTAPSALPPSATARPGNTASHPGTANLAAAAVGGGESFWQNPLHVPVIALSVASAALLVAFLITLITSRRSRRSRTTMDPPVRVMGSKGYPYSTPYDDGETWSPPHSAEKA